MKITLDKVAKRYNAQWIFRDLTYDFHNYRSYAITGPNGSGKSTLIKLISGSLSPSKGKITYSNDAADIERDDIYRHLSFSAPYIDLVEEIKLHELIDFHLQFKPFIPGHDRGTLLELLDLDSSRNKLIRDFSSGMKQRVKVGLTILTDSDLILLDEPATNLDEAGISWYRELIGKYR
ncbi:MAG: ATP-binding cassette domain-containing protein, partial [Bacteroidetes bacterium]|nr:ATP-binding cassette domain-containing protein [Bacteroidota bacterium]